MQVRLHDIEATFLRGNARLLAEQFALSGAQAQVIQARLWDNPTLMVEQMTYNPTTKRLLPLLGRSDEPGKPTTEQAVQLQQLFLLAGKRSKRTAIAQTNAQLTEQGYQEVLRNLKYELRRNFYDTYYLLQQIRVYDLELAALENTVGNMQILLGKGVVTQGNVMRVRSLLFSLQNERRDLQVELADRQSSLHVLGGRPLGTFWKPVVDSVALSSVDPQRFSLSAILNAAYENRPDLRAQQLGITLQQQQLAYQKALRTPDLQVGLNYDRAGSSVPHYLGLNASVPLPLFNRNQGNIRSAEWGIREAQVRSQAGLLQAEAEAELAYRKLQEADRLVRRYDPALLAV